MPRCPGHCARLLAAAGLLAAAMPLSAAAQAHLDAQYAVTLGGVPVGKGGWIVDIADNQYTAALSGTTLGLLRLLAPGEGSGAVKGNISRGHLVPENYAARIGNEKRFEDIRFNFVSGSVTDLVIEPVQIPNPERIPVTDAHRRNVVDPMTSALVRVPGSGQLVTAEACSRSASVFDGRLRYDLKLAFKRIEPVTTEKGYSGPVVVCSIYFKPIAGYIPDRPILKFLTGQRDMDIALAPIAGTRILAPYRLNVPTPLGQGTMTATQFVSEPAPRVTPTSAAAR